MLTIQTISVETPTGEVLFEANQADGRMIYACNAFHLNKWITFHVNNGLIPRGQRFIATLSLQYVERLVDTFGFRLKLIDAIESCLIAYRHSYNIPLIVRSTLSDGSSVVSSLRRQLKKCDNRTETLA